MSDSAATGVGYVYILVNPAMPSLVKIGRTVGQPELRAREVSRGTGVPAEFRVAWACPVDDCEAVERRLHDQLASHRFRPNREFFELPVAEAIERCSQLAESFRPGLSSDGSAERRPSRSVGRQEPKTDLFPLRTADRYRLMGRAGTAIKPWVEAYIAAVAEVCPDILVGVRDDGKVIFVPPNLADRRTRKNLTTINPRRSKFWLRIIDDVERMTGIRGEEFQPNILDSYRVRLRRLLERL